MRNELYLGHVGVPFWDVVASGLIDCCAQVFQGLGADKAMCEIHNVKE